MAQNFLGCDRDQELLLPPSRREWLPENHLAWCVIDAVAAMDLAAFHAAYRVDGHGRAAHEPAMTARCCSTPTRSASARRGASSDAAWRTSRQLWLRTIALLPGKPRRWSPGITSRASRNRPGVFLSALP
jgi:hypothetical protein